MSHKFAPCENTLPSVEKWLQVALLSNYCWLKVKTKSRKTLPSQCQIVCPHSGTRISRKNRNEAGVKINVQVISSDQATLLDHGMVSIPGLWLQNRSTGKSPIRPTTTFNTMIWYSGFLKIQAKSHCQIFARDWTAENELKLWFCWNNYKICQKAWLKYLWEIQGSGHDNSDGGVPTFSSCCEPWIISSHSFSPYNNCIGARPGVKNSSSGLWCGHPGTVPRSCGYFPIQSHRILQNPQRLPRCSSVQKGLEWSSIFKQKKEVFLIASIITYSLNDLDPNSDSRTKSWIS